MDKLAYLQNENAQLRDQIQDYKEILKMNKIEIDILSAQLQSNPHHKKIIDVVLGYRKKDDKMQKNLMVLKQELTQRMSDNLMLRQMTESSEEEIRNSEVLHRDAIQILNDKNKSLEEKLVFYERNYKEYDKVSGFVLKNRDIIGPNEMSLKLRDKEEEWKDQICIMKAEVEQTKKNADNLMVVNTVLRNKIVSLQAKLAMPNKNLGEVLDKSLKRLMLYFIEVQKKIITGEEDSDSDSQNDLELIAPELTGLFPQRQLRVQKDYGVPHIDLLKIRQQMNHATTKIKQALLARNHLSEKQKIQRLEIQLQYTRRELSRNIIELRDEKQTRKKAETFIQELQSRNQLLTSSNIQLEAKVRKYWDKLRQEKLKFYGVDVNQEENAMNEQFSSNLNDTLVLIEPVSKKLQQKKKNQIIAYEDVGESQIDYKMHMQILAKQLKRNEKLNNLSKLKNKKYPEIKTNMQEIPPQEQNPRRMKRSTSNPFLYFNERRQQIMNVDVNQKEKDGDDKYRLEQTCYIPGQNMRFEQVLDDQDI